MQFVITEPLMVFALSPEQAQAIGRELLEAGQAAQRQNAANGKGHTHEGQGNHLSSGRNRLILRQFLGAMRSWDDALADMRSGKTDVCGHVLTPAAKHYDGRAWRPAYALSAIKAFIRNVHASTKLAVVKQAPKGSLWNLTMPSTGGIKKSRKLRLWLRGPSIMAALQNFRRKACVDWLDVRLRTARPTQFQHVQSALEAAGAGKLHVTPIDPGPGVTDAMVVRCFDRLANSYAALSNVFAEFSARYPLAHAPEIAAIEVACDFLHTGEVERDASTIDDLSPAIEA
jgi:hypothetical protein